MSYELTFEPDEITVVPGETVRFVVTNAVNQSTSS
jgi:plastocyanin